MRITRNTRKYEAGASEGDLAFVLEYTDDGAECRVVAHWTSDNEAGHQRDWDEACALARRLNRAHAPDWNGQIEMGGVHLGRVA